MFEVKDKRAIVTGSAQGIGKAIVKELLRQGCRVCISDLLEDLGHETKEEMQMEFGLNDGSVCFIKCDVSSKSDWEALWQKAEKTLGGKIDLLCNNAGIPPQKEITRCISVMAAGTALGTAIAVQKMAKSNGGNGGRIVNIASIAGITNQATSLELGGYASAKYAIIALTRSFTSNTSLESEGIKCYALAPSAVDTAMLKKMYEDKSFTIANGLGKDKDDLPRISGMRTMSPEELAAALMKAIKLDKNGAVYAVVSDNPLIEYPFIDNQLFMLNMLLAKYLGGGSEETFSAKQFYVRVGVMVFITVYVIQWLVSILFGLLQ